MDFGAGNDAVRTEVQRYSGTAAQRKFGAVRRTHSNLKQRYPCYEMGHKRCWAERSCWGAMIRLIRGLRMFAQRIAALNPQAGFNGRRVVYVRERTD